MEGRAGDRAAGGPAGSKERYFLACSSTFRPLPMGDPRAVEAINFPGPSQPAKREGSGPPRSPPPCGSRSCSGRNSS